MFHFNANAVSRHAQRVALFMVKAKQATPEKPTYMEVDFGQLTPEVRRLRAELILEEALETIRALGFELTTPTLKTVPEGFSLKDYWQAVDGCCDLRVVTTGTLIAMGIPDELVQLEVDMNNLAKFAPGYSWREDGKLVKPPGHKPPELEKVVAGYFAESWEDATKSNFL